MNKPYELVIRRAATSDVHTLVDFNAALAKETENRILDVRILQSGVETLLQDPQKGWYAVAETFLTGSRNIVVGQMLVTFEWSDWRNKNFWWLQSVYVHPQYRHQGVFRQLYDYVHTQAHEHHDVCGFRLYVEENNLQAQTAYTKLDFHQTVYHMYEKEFL
jgi:GNAT superfamily N-acetyltransferase